MAHVGVCHGVSPYCTSYTPGLLNVGGNLNLWARGGKSKTHEYHEARNVVPANGTDWSQIQWDGSGSLSTGFRSGPDRAQSYKGLGVVLSPLSSHRSQWELRGLRLSQDCALKHPIEVWGITWGVRHHSKWVRVPESGPTGRNQKGY